MHESPFDSVLLIAFGGPTRSEEIRPFLENVTRGRRIPPERLEDVAHHYELIGGRSPLNELTFRQAAGLAEILRREGPDLPVYVGMRNWHPYLHETLDVMANEGRRRAVGVILSAQQSEASWDRYMGDVAAAQERVGSRAPEVNFTGEWHAHPGFIAAVAANVEAALARVPADRRDQAMLVFTAHSIPTPAAEGSPYIEQIIEGSRLVAEKVGHRPWSVAYQSRSGTPRDPWLEPDICDVLRDLAGKGIRDVVVEPIGFVCDHAEVLYDLDIEARQAADDLGLNFVRAASVNDHPVFVRMLADVVGAHVAQRSASG
jgi:ferrochelatase